MRRFFALLLTIALLCGTIPFCTSAQTTLSESRIDLEDGSYIIVTIEESDGLSRTTKNHNKNYYFYDSSDVLHWRMNLVATFTYDGTTVTCIAAGSNVNLYTNHWTVISENASWSGNKAFGYATLGRLAGGLVVDEYSYTLTLTCDPNGNVS